MMSSDPLNNPVYARFGVTPLINAGGTHTTHGGSMMRAEVREAMSLASESYVNLVELKRSTGDFVAEVTGAESGLICSGAAGGLLLATAAVMTGTDANKIAQLPDTTGLKNEILAQHNNPSGYMKCHEYAGAQIKLSGNEDGATSAQFEDSISDKTAGILYTFAYGPARNGLSLKQIVEIANHNGVPVIVDGAAMLPPKSNLTRYIEDGADLVTFSGGKYIGGPQSAGLLAGRKDLIEAALLNSGPEMAVGRPAKVGREEMIGMATALQLFIESDDEQRMIAMKDQADHIHNRLKNVPGITVSVEHDHLQFHVPNCVIKFNDDATAADRVWQALHRGNPRVYIARIDGGLAANMVNLGAGQELVVADRLIEAINQSMM